MRLNYSIKNSISSVMCYIVSVFIGFFTQTLFIRILGAEYLGLNGLFSNILGMLGIFELGIGNAIIYNLYKPVALNQIEEISSIMKFYKKVYNIIATVMTIVGLALVPVLKYIVGDVSVDVNIYVIYLLFLFQTISSYIITYKRSLIYANQRNYIINIVHFVYLVVANTTRLMVLYFTHNYYIFLIIIIVGQLLENVAINYIANRLYPFLKNKNVKPMNKEIEKDIFTKVKALIYHKVSTVALNFTDNIIISKLFGVVTVGLYSSYNIIVSYVSNAFSQVITSTTPSVGNMLVTENKEKCFDVFKKMRFFNFWIACFGGTAILLMIQPFIKIWIGESYLLDYLVVVTLVFNFFQKLMRTTYLSFKDSAGIWVEDKYIPLIETALNIIFSIILAKIFGLAGIFMGTVISGLVLWCYSYPKFVYKKLFMKSYINYAKETIGYILLFICIASISYVISERVPISNVYIKLIGNGVVATVIPNMLMFILFRKTENYKYFIEIVKKMIDKLLKKNKR